MYGLNTVDAVARSDTALSPSSAVLVSTPESYSSLFCFFSQLFLLVISHRLMSFQLLQAAPFHRRPQKNLISCLFFNTRQQIKLAASSAVGESQKEFKDGKY